MDKCVCSNNAEHVLPCYHKICDICLNDIMNTNDYKLVCNYPQCDTSFEREEVMLFTTTNDYNTHSIDICPIHNEEYTSICECDSVYCKKCDSICDKSHHIHPLGYFKKQVLMQMKELLNKLINKIKGLKCIIEIMNDYKSIIKKIDDIIDTILIDISHIYNFNKSINDLPISQIIKRKNKLLNNIITISEFVSNDIENTDKDLIKIVNNIIKNDGDIHASSNKVLELASKNGRLTIIENMIKYGADVHVNNDHTLLHASGCGHLDIVEYLLSCGGADIHAKNEALRLASCNGYIDIVKCLISHGTNVNAKDSGALRAASHNGHIDIVKCLISHGSNIHTQNEYGLRYASQNGHLAVVELLLSIRATNINANNSYAFRHASENGHLAIVKYLVSHGADVHANNDKALRDASINGHTEVVEYLTNI